MKKIWILTAIVMGTLATVATVLVTVLQFSTPKHDVNSVKIAVAATPDKIANGKRISTMLCVHCHSSHLNNSLSGARILDLSPALGVAYAPNITQHPKYGIGAWTDADLARLLRTGVKPNGEITFAMPKFAHIADYDLESIIAYLRSDDPILQPIAVRQPAQRPSLWAKWLMKTAPKPQNYPREPVAMPDTTRPAEHGRYLSNLYGCYACHSANFTTLNEYQPEKSKGFFGGGNLLYDVDGNKVYAPNITFDKHSGIGRWTEDQFVEALRTARTPVGYINQYPMPFYAQLSVDEARAIYAYLRTVPMVDNIVPRRSQNPEL